MTDATLFGVKENRGFTPQDAYLAILPPPIRRSVEKKYSKTSSPTDGVVIAGFEATRTPEDLTHDRET